MSSAAFQQAVAWVIAWEGGYTDGAGDPGNWTGGEIGAGYLNGTKFGISAAAYPTLDIQDLSVSEAGAIYLRDYWTPIHGDALPPALGMVIFDGAVNSGVAQSAQWLQVVVGTTADGVIGPETLAAVGNYPNGAAELAWEVLAQRVAADGCDPDFPTFGLGWSRRTSALAFQAAGMQAGA